MNCELDTFNQWLSVNKLKLNAEKTKYILLCHKDVEEVNELRIGNVVIERTREIKYLGCIIDEKLTFNGNCDYACKKLAKKVNFFSRISNRLDKETRILVYNTIIAPHISYCSTILFLSNKTQIERIQKLQNRCMKIILRKKWRTHSRTMLDELNWLSVKQQIHRDVLVFIYKVRNNMLPSYLSNCFQSNEGRAYILRNQGDLRLPLYRKGATQRSLMFDGVKLYNELPREIKLNENLKTFKKCCENFIKEKKEIL